MNLPTAGHFEIFRCPKCGGTTFGSSTNDDQSLTRHCSGNEQWQCDFSAHQSQDATCFERFVPEGETGTATGPREHPSNRRLLLEARNRLSALCGPDALLVHEIDVSLARRYSPPADSDVIAALKDTAGDITLQLNASLDDARTWRARALSAEHRIEKLMAKLSATNEKLVNLNKNITDLERIIAELRGELEAQRRDERAIDTFDVSRKACGKHFYNGIFNSLACLKPAGHTDGCGS